MNDEGPSDGDSSILDGIVTTDEGGADDMDSTRPEVSDEAREDMPE